MYRSFRGGGSFHSVSAFQFTLYGVTNLVTEVTEPVTDWCFGGSVVPAYLAGENGRC